MRPMLNSGPGTAERGCRELPSEADLRAMSILSIRMRAESPGRHHRDRHFNAEVRWRTDRHWLATAVLSAMALTMLWLLLRVSWYA